MDIDQAPLSLLHRRLPASFVRRVIALAPHTSRAYHPAEWRGAIVEVECGRIELEWLDGSCLCFERGAVLWLDGLPLRALHNHGSAPAVLVAVARRAAVTSSDCTD
jgi:hypothetical protein